MKNTVLSLQQKPTTGDASGLVRKSGKSKQCAQHSNFSILCL